MCRHLLAARRRRKVARGASGGKTPFSALRFHRCSPVTTAAELHCYRPGRVPPTSHPPTGLALHQLTSTHSTHGRVATPPRSCAQDGRRRRCVCAITQRQHAPLSARSNGTDNPRQTKTKQAKKNRETFCCQLKGKRRSLFWGGESNNNWNVRDGQQRCIR